LESEKRYKVLHLINDMSFGGAQKTLRNLTDEENIYTIKKSKNHKSFLNLFKEVRLSKEKIIVFSWLYHSIFFGCFFKFFFKKKIIHAGLIRNGYRSPYSISKITRLVIKLSSLFSSKFCDHIIFCSQSSREEHFKENLFKKVKSSVVYNGVKIPKEKFLKKKNFNIGMIARFEKQKNFSLIKEIINYLNLHKIHLSILTDKKEALVNFLSLGDSSFVKVFDNREIHKSEIFKVCSHHLLVSKSEGFANVNLEALSFGCNLISTRVGDSHLFPSKWCTLVDDEKNDLENKISKLKKSFDENLLFNSMQEKIDFLENNFPEKIESDYLCWMR